MGAPLPPSTRLGPYELVEPIGSGGMGAVYRALDTRLSRQVAVKVLPTAFAGDEQRRARFEREARTISSVNHPNICTLFDVGSAHLDGSEVQYLVLELIEGESLARRLAKGPLPTNQLLSCAIQIAAALDAAHRRGIVHRDLKPGNVMLTKSGAKLLDFGLARLVENGADAEHMSALSKRDETLTDAGTILGTLRYMAPEQLEGQRADARTDIFALGALLYEMATGQKAFEGDTRTGLIASIVSSQPAPISALQPMSPPAMDHVARKCLEKDPDERWQSAKDVMSELQWIKEGGSAAGVVAPMVAERKRRERVAWFALGLAAATAVSLSVASFRRGGPKALVRFTISAPKGMSDLGSPRISPDGRFVAFYGTDASRKQQLWVRSLDELEARPLPGTEGGGRPFWSPDGRYVGFMADGKLKKIDVSGGPPQTICDAPTGVDGTWSTSGVILFDGRPWDSIRMVPASGGVPKPEVLADPARGVVVSWPEFLPDGRHFLYLAGPAYLAGPPLSPERQLMLGTLDSKEARPILKVRGAAHTQYATPGYLLYARDQTLMAHPFDLEGLELRGEPIPIAEGVGSWVPEQTEFSASENGTLIYSASTAAAAELVWLDRSGRKLGTLGDPGNYSNPALSPDEKSLAVGRVAAGARSRDLWVFDLVRGTSTRLTFDPADDLNPAWSPDGTRIAFSSDRKGARHIYSKRVDGSRADELLASEREASIEDWSPDGRLLLYNQNTSDLYLLPLSASGERKPIPFLVTEMVESMGRFAPGGRWIAYRSNESGRDEIYVRGLSRDGLSAGGKWQVSTGGGLDPQWRRDGRELFYVTGTTVMAVDVKTAGVSFEAGPPKPLFEARLVASPRRNRYVASRDGQRFLTVAPPEGSAVPLTVVLNWAADLQN